MSGSGTVQNCRVIRSTDNGATWSSPSVIAILGVDKNWIAADQTSGPYANYLYTVMTASSGGNFKQKLLTMVLRLHKPVTLPLKVYQE